MNTELQISIRHAPPDGFSMHFDASLPLRGISALFGPSGSGKTTVLNCIAGLRQDLEMTQIRVGDTIWQNDTQRVHPWRRRVGYVFQDARLLPHLSVDGNLRFAESRAHSPDPSLRREQVINWLQLADLLPQRPQTLSAGQAQRVAIARALLSRPQLLLLDEPLANLDRQASAHCLQCLSQVARESELPMLFVSHRIEEVASIAERLLLIDEGRLVGAGPLPELLTRLDSSLAEEENAAAVINAQVTSRDDTYGLTELNADGHPLFVASLAEVGASRRVRIPARDVSVCRHLPTETSILNILPVTLDSLRSVTNTHCLLRLRLAEQYLLARITERSRSELELKVGDSLYAQIKSSALLDDRSPS